jgi:hypothetical protein
MAADIPLFTKHPSLLKVVVAVVDPRSENPLSPVLTVV